MTQADLANTPETDPHSPRGGWRKAVNLLLCLLLLGAGFATAAYFKKTAPKARKRPPVKMIPLVQVQTLQPVTQPIVVTAMGTVLPAREIVLKSRVAGDVVALHPEFIDGGLIPAGQEILRINPADYRLTVLQKQSMVADATAALKLELGRQDVAQREWQLLNGDNPVNARDKELVLRQPQLEKARADLEAAKADLEKARLDLTRTRIRSPFNVLVRTKQVDVGSQVTTQDTLATLVNTDQYWVQVSLPVDRLQWITVPHTSGVTGSTATVVYRSTFKRNGRVLKLLGDLETDGRMARLLLSVKDPLGLGNRNSAQPPLAAG